MESYGSKILDYYIDGQLGFNGENCLVPRLMDGFSDLGSPESTRQESGQKNESPLKVLT